MSYLLLFALNAALMLGSDSAPIAKSLTVDSKKIMEAPNFPTYGDAQCDEDGDLFFHVANGNYDNPELLEISHDGQSGATFKLSPELIKSTTFDGFFAAPSGRVYLLVQASSTRRLLFSFDRKGETGDPVHLETPSHLLIQAFVVFQDGASLIAGSYNDAADAKVHGAPYAAIFEPSGQLRKVLSKDITGTGKNETSESRLPEGAATLGDDGNLYFVAHGGVTVLSSSGSIVRRFEYPKPDPEWAATSARVSKGLLAIGFSHVNRRHAIEKRYLVVSTLSGDVLGWYQPTDETGSVDVCFAEGKELVFMGSNDAGKLYLVTAPLK